MSIGPIIDESLDQKFVNITTCAKARQVLLVKWLVLGFCLTACYKSVLLSNMVNIGFEKTIDTVEDALDSGKLLLVPDMTDIPSKIHNNARANVRKLANQMKLFNLSISSGQLHRPQWTYDGSVYEYDEYLILLFSFILWYRILLLAELHFRSYFNCQVFIRMWF